MIFEQAKPGPQIHPQKSIWDLRSPKCMVPNPRILIFRSKKHVHPHMAQQISKICHFSTPEFWVLVWPGSCEALPLQMMLSCSKLLCIPSGKQSHIEDGLVSVAARLRRSGMKVNLSFSMVSVPAPTPADWKCRNLQSIVLGGELCVLNRSIVERIAI